MTWLLLVVLGWLWHALVFAQGLPFPGPGVKGYAAAGGPYTDNFNRADGALGANWTDNLNSHTIATNAVRGTAASDSISSYTAQNLGTDHYGQVTIGAQNADDNVGACVRVSGTSAYCYYAFSGTANRVVYRINAGVFTTLVSASTAHTTTNGDILKVAVSGTGATVTLTVTLNGALDTGLSAGGTVSDTSASRLTSGNFAGISVFNNVAKVDDFVCNTGG